MMASNHLAARLGTARNKQWMVGINHGSERLRCGRGGEVVAEGVGGGVGAAAGIDRAVDSGEVVLHRGHAQHQRSGEPVTVGTVQFRLAGGTGAASLRILGLVTLPSRPVAQPISAAVAAAGCPREGTHP